MRENEEEDKKIKGNGNDKAVSYLLNKLLWSYSDKQMSKF